jgi:branched-chain amino acid transport system permease protein
MYFIMTTIMLMEIYLIVSLALNFLLGVAGRFSAYEAAIMGVGAYTAALLSQNLGVDLLVGCLVGAIFCAAIGVLFQVMTRYMDFFTFKITSFALQMTLWQTFMTWRAVTKGSNGIYGVTRPVIFGFEFTSMVAYFWLTTVLSLIVVAGLLYLERSQFALALRGLRDGENALESLGKNTFALKLKVFALSGAATGFAGGLLAGLLQSVSPYSFYVYVSVIFIIFVIAGGRGNLLGTVIAVVVLTIIQESIKMIPGLPTTWIGPLQQIFYGVMLLAVITLRPSGIIPEKPIVRRESLKKVAGVLPGFSFLTPPQMRNERA